MATQVDNEFTSYEFTDEELISAATFNILQRMYIQTQRAATAAELLATPFDAMNPTAFIEARGFSRGFIAACDFFLDHEKAEEARARWEQLQQDSDKN